MASQHIAQPTDRRVRQPLGLTLFQGVLLLTMLVIGPNAIFSIIRVDAARQSISLGIDPVQAVVFGVIFLVCAMLTVEVSEYNFVTSAHLVALAVVYTLGYETAIGLTLIMLFPTYFALMFVVRSGIRTFITPLANRTALPHLAGILAMASISFQVAGVVFDSIGGVRPASLGFGEQPSFWLDPEGLQLLRLGISYLMFQLMWRVLLGTYIGLLRGGFSLRPFMPTALSDGLVDPFVLLTMLLMYERYKLPGVLLLLVPIIGISRLLSDLTTAKRALQHVLSQVTYAHEEERKRISRELHDGTAQALASQLALVDVTQRLLAEDPPETEQARALLKELRRQANDTLTDVRRFSRNLRPSLLDDLGLVAALRWYTQDFAKSAPFEVNFRINDPFNRWKNLDEDVSALRLPAPVELAVFRLVQEALTNVRKHANAKHVDVTLRLGLDNLEVLVQDDGRGLPPVMLNEEGRNRANRLAAGGHLGLLSMHERTEQLGGSLSIESRPGRGTVVRARLPL